MWLCHKLGWLPQKPSCDRVAVTRFLVTVKGHAHIDFSHFFSTWSRYFWRTEEAQTLLQRDRTWRRKERPGTRVGHLGHQAPLVRIPPFFRVTGWCKNQVYWVSYEDPEQLIRLPAGASGKCGQTCEWTLKIGQFCRLALQFLDHLLSFFKTTLVVTVFEAWGPCTSIQLMICSAQARHSSEKSARREKAFRWLMGLSQGLGVQNQSNLDFGIDAVWLLLDHIKRKGQLGNHWNEWAFSIISFKPRTTLATS